MAITWVGSAPSVGVTEVSERAQLLSKRILEAYYLQDERESYVLQGKPEAALEVADEALERMADVYELEFPDQPSQAARLAGKEFMRGLFIQDEIENWGLIQQAPGSEYLREVLYSDRYEGYGSNQSRDERWERVRDRLRTTCEKVDIDPQYAERQTQFWLLHGQLQEYWEEVAKEAHTLKLRAMVPDPSPNVEDALGEYFVKGVKQHDEWTHRDESDDLDPLREHVEVYYQKILELR